MTGMTVDILKAQAMEGALRQVKTDLALAAISEAEKLEVAETEIGEECQRLADQYGMKAEEVKKVVPLEDLKKDLMNRKAAKVIFDSAKVGKAPAKKAPAKKVEKEEAKAEEKKSAAKKPATKKTEAKTEEKKPAAKKTTKKAKTEE